MHSLIIIFHAAPPLNLKFPTNGACPNASQLSILKPKRQTDKVHFNDNSKLNASFVHETQDIHKEETVEIMLQLTPPIYNHMKREKDTNKYENRLKKYGK